MKLLITGDWHYTDKQPDCRIDDYQISITEKIEHIFKRTEEEEISLILQAGDLTDTPFLSYSTYIELSNLLSKFSSASVNTELYRYNLMTVYGQHDLRYRNKGNTPLDALASSGLITILSSDPSSLYPRICIYGCSFGETHPQIQNPNSFNILILHQLIVSSQERDWEKDQILHSALLQNSKWDLVVSGDNHLPFIISTGGKKQRHLINCGSLMRSTIEQVDHEPFFVIFDTNTRTYEKHFLKIKPWQEVFDLERKVKQEERNENLEIYAESLKEQKDMGLDYTANLIAYMQGNKVEKPVEEIVTECITLNEKL
jgi:DNA repair exonuclease SbcCD nuclease subunit